MLVHIWTTPRFYKTNPQHFNTTAKRFTDKTPETMHELESTIKKTIAK